MFAQVDGYSILRQDRNRHGGGVALYIDNSYKASLLCSSPTQVKGKPGIPQYLMGRVQRGKIPPVFVAVVYSPPDVSFSCFKDSDIFTNLTKHSKGYDYRIVMGDLNANMLSSSQETNFIRDFVCEHNFKLFEYNATNHVGDSHTWIDVIYTDDDNVVLNANNIMPTFPNSYNIIDVELDFQIVKPTILNSFSYRDFNPSLLRILFHSSLLVTDRHRQVTVME